MEPTLRIHQLLARVTEYPCDANTLGKLALAYLAIAANEQVLHYASRATELAPSIGDNFYLKARALSELERPAEAAEDYKRAIALGTRMSRPSVFLAMTHLTLGDNQGAINVLTQAIQTNPSDRKAYLELAACFIDRPLDQIIWEVERTLAGAGRPELLKSGAAEALCRRARFDEAAALGDAALASHPNCAQVWYVRGMIALRGFLDAEEALRYHSHAATLDARWIDAVTGDLLHLGRYEQAREKFLRGNPQFADLFEQQESSPDVVSNAKPAIDGKVIVARCTSGLGDAVLGARFASWASEKGAEVTLQCAKPISSALRTTPGVARVISHEEGYPASSTVLSLWDLAWLFPQSAEKVGSCVPYVLPPQSSTAQFRARLPVNSQLTVGIAWRGSRAWFDQPHRYRSIPLGSFGPLFEVPGVTWISLQKGSAIDELHTSPAGRHVLQIGLEDDGADLGDTAAAITILDLVVTVDTSIAHLAGAVGKPTFVLLPYTAWWAWSLHGSRTPWYPTFRLFRQRAPGDWEWPIQQAKGALESLVRASGPTYVS